MARLAIGFAAGVVAAVLVAIAVWLAVVYTGAYNVTASDQHADAVRWTLDTTMHRSVASRAGKIELPEDVLAAGDRCTFNRSPETDPVLWADHQSGAAAMKLNGVLVVLEAIGETEADGVEFSAPRSPSDRSATKPTGARMPNSSSNSIRASPSATAGSTNAGADAGEKSSQGTAARTCRDGLQGTDVPFETADGTLLPDRVIDVATKIRLARPTMRNVRQNTAIALG